MESLESADDLAALHAALWVELERCVADKAHGWRVATLATRAGDSVDARSVVLREVDAAQQQLIFYTDARSPKAAQLRAQAEAHLVCWCPRLGWQLRAKVVAEVLTEGPGRLQPLGQAAPEPRRLRLPLPPAAGQLAQRFPSRPTARTAQSLRAGAAAGHRAGLAGSAQWRPTPRRLRCCRRTLAQPLIKAAASSAGACSGRHPYPLSDSACQTRHGTCRARSARPGSAAPRRPGW